MSKVKRPALPQDHFTIISNEWTRDAALTWGARGLLTWLVGHAADHEITEADIIDAGPVGRDGVRALIRELEQARYLRRERTPIATGGSVVDYVLMDPRATDYPSLGGDGISVPRSDQAKRGESPGGSNDGISVAPSYRENQKKNTTPSVSGRAPRSERATRVPEDFQPDEKMRAWFAAEKLAQVIDGRWEHEKFMDYWRAEPGAKGRKLDWPATWRRWMREAAQRAQRSGYVRPVSAPPGNSLIPTGAVPPVGAFRPSTTDQKLAQTIELGRRLQAMEETA